MNKAMNRQKVALEVFILFSLLSYMWLLAYSPHQSILQSNCLRQI